MTTQSIQTIYIYIYSRLIHGNDYYLKVIEDFKPKYAYKSVDCYGDYRLAEDTSYELQLTYIDTIKKTISGRFDFKFVIDAKDGCPDTLHVTQGRFDLKYEIVY